jgi:hypothetical protein
MRIRWQSIFALMLIVVFVIAVSTQKTAIGQFLGSIGNLSPGHSPEEQVLGLIALMIVMVGFIVAVRSLSRNRNR